MKTNQIIALLAIALFSFTFACNKKTSENADPKKMIYGDGEKSWKASKETNGGGEKQELSSDEKSEVMKFNSNGTFMMDGTTENLGGTWTYDDASKTLSLKFNNAEVTENFQMMDMGDNEMKLKAGDGSVMVLKAK